MRRLAIVALLAGAPLVTTGGAGLAASDACCLAAPGVATGSDTRHIIARRPLPTGRASRPGAMREVAQAPPSQPAIPRYEVNRAPSPPTIDGKLDDPAWSLASSPIVLQFLWDSQTGAKQKTAARLLWDAQALYVGFDADDADVTARFLNRDDPTYRDDAVEIFINPDPKQEMVYYGFEMNARGVLYDYLNYNSRTLFKRFDATGMTIASAVRGTLNESKDVDNGFSLEAAIPWANFEELSRRPPVAGTVWKANVNRWDGVEPKRRMSIWSDPQNTTSWPHVPSRFGEIVFKE